MIRIASIIRQMILEGQSVDVPGLGTFQVRHIPSNFDHVNMQLNPPSREIIFEENRYLQNASFISLLAKKESVSVEEAFQQLAEYLGGIYAQLDEGKRVKLSGLGFIFKDEEGKIKFEPEDDLFSSGEYFGFKPVPVSIKKKKKKKKTKKKQIIFRVFLGFLLLAGLAATIYWGLMVYKMMQNQKAGLTNQNTDKKTTILTKAAIKPHTHDTLPPFPRAVKKASDLFPEVKFNSVKSVGTSIKTEKKAEINQESEVAQNVEESTDIGTQKYYVIAGCFRSEEGARRYVKQLKDDGWEALLVGKTASGLNMVAYGSYLNRSLAEQELKRIRQDENKDAYIVLR